MIVYVLLSWVFLASAGFFEIRRFRRLGGFDVFSLIALVFAVSFVLAPTILYWASPDDWSFSKFTWMRRLPKNVEPYVLAILLVVGSYLCIYGGYAVSAAKRRLPSEAGERAYLVAGLVLTVVGVVAFVSFLEIVGGPLEAFRKAWFLRSGTPNDIPFAQFAFVKRLSFFVVPGSVFLLQAASRRVALWPLAVLGVIAALVILTFMQGRLQLVIYVAPLLLALWVLRHRATSTNVFASLCWVCMIFATIGGTKTQLQSSAAWAEPPQKIETPAVRPTGGTIAKQQPGAKRVETAPKKIETPVVSSRPYYLSPKLVSVGLEFAFPFCNLISVLTTKPELRWFTDLVLPVFHLIPKRIVPIGEYLPPKLSDLNTVAQAGSVPWGIPVDLVSFGYFSLGWAGVVLASFGFGWLARRIELMMPTGNYGDEVFRFSWLVLIGALVMYGDPNWVVVEQFHWLVALFIYVMFIPNRTLPDKLT